MVVLIFLWPDILKLLARSAPDLKDSKAKPLRNFLHSLRWNTSTFTQSGHETARAGPATWTTQSMLDIALRGQGTEGVLKEMLVLLGFVLVFLLSGI